MTYMPLASGCLLTTCSSNRLILLGDKLLIDVWFSCPKPYSSFIASTIHLTACHRPNCKARLIVLRTVRVTGLVSDIRGAQPTGDTSQKPTSRLSLLSVRPAVIFPSSEHHRPWPVPIYTAWRKKWGMVQVGTGWSSAAELWLIGAIANVVWYDMEWRPARHLVCMPLLIFPCTTKSRSSFLAPAHPGGPGRVS